MPTISSVSDSFFFLKLLNSASGQNRAPMGVQIHIPKTAGTAISRWLDEEIELVHMRSRRALSRPHIPNKDYILYLGHLSSDLPIKAGVFSSAQFDQTFSFTFVRHPVSRLVSLYHHLQSWDALELTFHEFVDLIINPADIPNPKLRRRVVHMSRPMVHWVFPKLWAGPQFIYRQEDLQLGKEDIAKHLRIGGNPRVVGKSESSTDSVELSQRCLEKISDRYVKDFEHFGYTPSTGFLPNSLG